MRNLEEVTEEEMKTAYENTPALCEYFTWEQVQENPTLIITLKNQVIAKEEQKMEIQNGTNNVYVLPFASRVPAVANTPLPAPAPAPKKEIRRSTITLDEKQIALVMNALVLGRNCLMSFNLGDTIRSEALADLAEAQKLLKSFYAPRH
jgi:hypothetical protein